MPIYRVASDGECRIETTRKGWVELVAGNELEYGVPSASVEAGIRMGGGECRHDRGTQNAESNSEDQTKPSSAGPSD
jgi:hypothetical protein